MNKILTFLKEKNKNIVPFNLTDNHEEIFKSLEVYGIKMGFSDIEKTLNFVDGFTLEPPMSFYGKAAMETVDFIFYNGNMTPARTLNIPDINRIAFDVGYLPSEEFPSDHISFCADFYLNNI